MNRDELKTLGGRVLAVAKAAAKGRTPESDRLYLEFRRSAQSFEAGTEEEKLWLELRRLADEVRDVGNARVNLETTLNDQIQQLNTSILAVEQQLQTL